MYGVSKYADFDKFLESNGVENCTRKETNSALILTTETADQYRKLHAILRQECAAQSGKETFGAIQLHSYQLKSDRAFVIYIWGLPSTMSTDEIKDELTKLHFDLRRVTNVPRKVDNVLVPRPLFRVELEPNPKNSEIYGLTNLLKIRITVESFKPRSDPPLCRNCQRIGHTKHYCLRTPRCVKCGGDHTSDKCILDKSAPCICANCQGPHPATYRGCKVFKKHRKSQHSAVEEIRTRGMAQTVSSPAPSLELAQGKGFLELSPVKNQSSTNNRLPNTSSPNRSIPRIFSSVAESPAAASLFHDIPVVKDFPSAAMDILLSLSNQITQLATRLTSLEQSISTSNWQLVSSNRSRQHHG